MLWSHLLLITSRPCLQILPNFDLKLNFQSGETVFESEHKGGRRLQAYVKRHGRGKEKGMWSKTKRPMCLHALSKHLWLNYWEPEVFEERMETDKNTKIVEHPPIEEQIGARGPYSSKGMWGSCREPQVTSQHQHQAAHNGLWLQCSRWSDGLSGLLRHWVHIDAFRHIHINIEKVKWGRENAQRKAGGSH